MRDGSGSEMVDAIVLNAWMGKAVARELDLAPLGAPS